MWCDHVFATFLCSIACLSDSSLLLNSRLLTLILQVNFDAMIQIMSARKLVLSPPTAGWSPLGLPHARTPALVELSHELQQVSGLAHGVRARHEAHQQACEAIKAALLVSEARCSHSRYLEAAVLPAFAQAFNRDSQLKLRRFSNLKDKLASDVVPALYKEAAEACWPAIEIACEHARGEQAVRGRLSHDPYSVLAGKVADLLAQELMGRLDCIDKLKAKAGPTAAWLQEDTESKAKRHQVEAKRDAIESAYTTINLTA